MNQIKSCCYFSFPFGACNDAAKSVLIWIHHIQILRNKYDLIVAYNVRFMICLWKKNSSKFIWDKKEEKNYRNLFGITWFRTVILPYNYQFIQQFRSTTDPFAVVWSYDAFYTTLFSHVNNSLGSLECERINYIFRIHRFFHWPNLTKNSTKSIWSKVKIKLNFDLVQFMMVIFDSIAF